MGTEGRRPDGLACAEGGSAGRSDLDPATPACHPWASG